MIYTFKFRPYRRRFVRTVSTSHGKWDIRDGIIVRLTDESGRVGWGEIAPISWFGSETIEQALDFCRQLPAEITDETIFSIPDELPACQFGFESAQEGVGRWGNGEIGGTNVQWPMPNAPCPMPHAQFSALLPAGEAALNQWESLWQQGYRTFKWKIGVDAIANELKIFELLARTLPAISKLRLDANGGLNYEEANLWLWTCDNLQANRELNPEIEFIEQPLPVEQFPGMLELSMCYGTAIALDESVATLKQLIACYQQGWRGIFVIKPGIIGSPSRLRKFCQENQIEAVFSSVFESAIGRQAALQLAAELSQNHRAIGFGIDHFFEQEHTWLQSLWKTL
ncbi:MULTISPECIES: o-succinylbenzoate synthase [Nostoc]|uniref:o-succinylbenzoate synthase n=1 Tax=Nostoc paludosum FACHB-159 TaxID=2692908 RepID=A0ABR8K6L6_9NOSO|nr:MULTISPECIES: o-succinylbenzoate synthase [Nostoc]MBD2678002.1 o-succinylbenzoate synthase [Nostoc sp. FACHB-857]MBD2733822.1 o-succinylbenzoate synthase [Nostoc paludosum FACHB-159]